MRLGDIILSITDLTTDTAVKIGDYVNQPTPTPVSGISGDANGDGVVDGMDYVVWLVNLGINIIGGAGVGDFDNNGQVDGVDYVMWLQNYLP